MFVAGIDIGSLSAKSLIMEDGEIREWAIMPSGTNSADSAIRVTEQALSKMGLSLRDLEYVCGTGYGRVNIPFAQSVMSEISCHAKGCSRLFPEVRTILDVGGQDCKVIRCDEQGVVGNFVLNDKCAAGTGRYLERVAATVGLELDEIGPLSLQTVNGALPVSNFCAVFAEKDISKYMREDKPIADILAGAMETIVGRLITLMKQVGIEEALCMSGGVAKNVGVVRRIEENLGLKVRIAPEPQIVGALGAALFAAEGARCRNH